MCDLIYKACTIQFVVILRSDVEISWITILEERPNFCFQSVLIYFCFKNRRRFGAMVSFTGTHKPYQFNHREVKLRFWLWLRSKDFRLAHRCMMMHTCISGMCHLYHLSLVGHQLLSRRQAITWTSDDYTFHVQNGSRFGSMVSGTYCAWAISITDHLDRIHYFDRVVSCSSTNAWSDCGSFNDLRKYHWHYNWFFTWDAHVYVCVAVCRIPILIRAQDKQKMLFLSRYLCSVYIGNNERDTLPLRMFLAPIRYNIYQ